MLTQSDTNDCWPHNLYLTEVYAQVCVCVVVLSPSPRLLYVSLRTRLRQFIHTPLIAFQTFFTEAILARITRVNKGFPNDTN